MKLKIEDFLQIVTIIESEVKPEFVGKVLRVYLETELLENNVDKIRKSQPESKIPTDFSGLLDDVPVHERATEEVLKIMKARDELKKAVKVTYPLSEIDYARPHVTVCPDIAYKILANLVDSLNDD